MTHATSLTSGRLLARNVALNLLGWGLPAVAALVAMPLLVRGLGDARFGVLALAWTTIGYFSLFDLGIGRALTRAVADRLGGARAEQEGIGVVMWTSVAVIIPVGVFGAILLLAISPWLVRDVLHVPPELRAETIVAFRVLALAIPFTGAAAAFRGLLEAGQRFGIINALRVPYGLLTFLGPLAVLPFSRSVVPAIAVLAVGRMVLCGAYAVASSRLIPELGGGARHFDGTQARSLVAYGGWMTVSNVISPLMNTFDRFVIGAVMHVAVVTYYAAPHELVTKMWLYTAALWPVFFPAFALTGTRDSARNAALFDRALRLTFAGLVLPTFLLVLLAREILHLWLGPGFAVESAVAMQVLAAAVFVNSLGQGAYTLIQGLGRPDLTGKYHLAELPFYALLLWWLLPRYGITGVAIAWAVRAVVDALLLLLTCPRLLPASAPAIHRMLLWLGLSLPLIVAAAFVPSVAARVAVAAAAAPLWLWLAWRGMLSEAERSAPAQLLSAALPRA